MPLRHYLPTVPLRKQLAVDGVSAFLLGLSALLAFVALSRVLVARVAGDAAPALGGVLVPLLGMVLLLGLRLLYLQWAFAFPHSVEGVLEPSHIVRVGQLVLVTYRVAGRSYRKRLWIASRLRGLRRRCLVRHHARWPWLASVPDLYH